MRDTIFTSGEQKSRKYDQNFPLRGPLVELFSELNNCVQQADKQKLLIVKKFL